MQHNPDVIAFHIAAGAFALALHATPRGHCLRGVALALWAHAARSSDSAARTAADSIAVAAYTLATDGDRQQLVLQARRLAWAVPQLDSRLAGRARLALKRLRAVLAAQEAAS